MIFSNLSLVGNHCIHPRKAAEMQIDDLLAFDIFAKKTVEFWKN